MVRISGAIAMWACAIVGILSSAATMPAGRPHSLVTGAQSCGSASRPSSARLASPLGKRQFYSTVNASISLPPGFGCQHEAESKLFGGDTQTIWSLLRALSPDTTCYSDMAQLMCMTMYTPCDSTVASSVCSAAVGAAASCPALVQSVLLPLLIPNFATTYGACATSPAFNETGDASVAGPMVLSSCQRLSHNVVHYPIYVPFGGSQSVLEGAIAGVIPLLGQLPSANCAKNLKNIICTQAYTKCDTYPLIRALGPLLSSGRLALDAQMVANLTQVLPLAQVPFPRLTCNSLCKTASSVCGATLIRLVPGLAELLANGCSVTSPGTVLKPSVTCSGTPIPGTGQPNYPLVATTLGNVTIGGATVTLQSNCNDLGESPCVALPSSSICAPFFPPGALVDINPSFGCMDDAESSLSAAPLVWQAVGLSLPPTSNSSCRLDLAQLMCFAVFKPCNSFVSRGFCRSVLGSNATNDDGSCPKSLQRDLLTTLVPGFSTLFSCDLNPVFAEEPLGVGTQVAQVPPPPIAAAECQPLNRNSICRGVIDYDVYVPANFYGDQSRIESQIASMFSTAFMLANLDNGCVESLEKALCSTVYTRCDTTVLAQSLAGVVAAGVLPADIASLPLAFPSLPCHDLCQRVQEQCGLLISKLAPISEMFNCSGRGLILTPSKSCNGKVKGLGGENFPVNSSTLATVAVGGQSVEISSTCNAFKSVYPSNATSVITCPWFLAPRASPTDRYILLGGSCSTPCPNFLTTKEERADSDKFFSALTVLSFVSSLVIWATWIIFPSKRKQRITLCFSTCVFMLSFAMLVSVIATKGQPSTISCRNKSEPVLQSDGGACVFQAVFMFFFALAAVAFWLASALDLYLKIVLNLRIGPILQHKLNTAYLVLGWGFPFLLLVIGLATQSFGGSTGTPWCFFKYDINPAADWSLFYFEIFAMLMPGFFFMASVIWRMIVSARLTGSAAKPGWWKTQIRPAMFIGVFLFVFGFMFAYRVHIWQQIGSYQESGTVWVTCMLTTAGDESVCGKKPKVSPNLGLFYIIQIVVGGQGFFNSIIFGTQRNNWTLWYGLLTGRGTAWNGQKSQAESHDSKSGQSAQSGQSGQSAKSGDSARPIRLGRTNQGGLSSELKDTSSASGAVSATPRKLGQSFGKKTANKSLVSSGGSSMVSKDGEGGSSRAGAGAGGHGGSMADIEPGAEMHDAAAAGPVNSGGGDGGASLELPSPSAHLQADPSSPSSSALPVPSDPVPPGVDHAAAASPTAEPQRPPIEPITEEFSQI